MAIVWIPAMLRELTGGRERTEVSGATVREVIASLETLYPGIQERLCDDDQLRPNLVVAVDGQVSREKLRKRVDENSEIHFLPALSGG